MFVVDQSVLRFLVGVLLPVQTLRTRHGGGKRSRRCGGGAERGHGQRGGRRGGGGRPGRGFLWKNKFKNYNILYKSTELTI